MKKEARQSARDIQICPRSSTNPRRQKILTFCSAAPRQTSATVAPPSALPRNCDAPFSTLPAFLRSLTVHLRALRNTKKTIRRPYPLPQERFHYRGEDALSCAVRDRSKGAPCRAQVSDPVHLEHVVIERGLKAPVHNMTSYGLYYLSHYTFTVCPLFIFIYFSQGNGGELRWRPSRGAPSKSRTLTLTCCKEANNLTESGFLKVFCYFFWGDKATRQRRIFEP
jgi:hypothetical protein